MAIYRQTDKQLQLVDCDAMNQLLRSRHMIDGEVYMITQVTDETEVCELINADKFLIIAEEDSENA